MKQYSNPLPVILDTDIADIDDTWAIGYMLKRPELDPRLIVTCNHNTVTKARIACKLLEIAGRTDIDVGVGIKQSEKAGHQAPWADGYGLADYPGRVYADGIQAMIDRIMADDTVYTLIAIGPCTNIAEALRREPRIAPKTRLLGMHGSLFRGYGEGSGPSGEYNVTYDKPAFDVVFAAPWKSIEIVPLDACDGNVLAGERFQTLLANRQDPVLNAVLENFEIWDIARSGGHWPTCTSGLHDTVAIYAACTHDNLKYDRLPVYRDGSFTRVGEQGVMMDCALGWDDRERFLDDLTNRLIGESVTLD